VVNRQQAINEALAVHLFGWRKEPMMMVYHGQEMFRWYTPEGRKLMVGPEMQDWCTSWSGMGEVVEAMRGKGWMYVCICYSRHYEGGWKWFVMFENETEEGPEGCADTAPMAVAMAALAALGVAVPREGEGEDG
jgi:hypothetical protein